MICLDSGCGDYERLWLTTSLRGLAGGQLGVKVLDEGVHSGDASGVVASSFRISRQLLSRLEDPATGGIVPEALWAQMPADRHAQAGRAAGILGEQVWTKVPFVAGMTPVTDDPVELILNRTWRPQLAVVEKPRACPQPADAGNVLRPYTVLKLSVRLPPTLKASEAAAKVREVLEADPPYGSKVAFQVEGIESGWNAPAMASWLETAVDAASKAAFGQPAAMLGEGGSIPFMGMLGKKFPDAQFMITGRAGTALERARAEERIPRHPDREAGDRMRRPRAGGAFLQRLGVEAVPLPLRPAQHGVGRVVADEALGRRVPVQPPAGVHGDVMEEAGRAGAVADLGGRDRRLAGI